MMNRRAFLAGLTGAATISTASDITPVMEQFARWRALHAWINSPSSGDMSDDDLEAACDYLLAIEDKMIDTPAQTDRDVLAKLMAYTSMGQTAFSDMRPVPKLWQEVGRVLGA